MKTNKYKRLSAWALAGLCLFGTTGCYSVEEPNEVTAETAAVTEATVAETVTEAVEIEATTAATENVSDDPAEAPAETSESESGAPDLNFAAAAEALGVTEEAVMAAFGDPNDGPPDMAEVAATFNVTEEELTDLMGIEEMSVSTIMDPYDVTINGVTFEVTQPMYDWDEIPDTVSIERLPVESYTNSLGETHWYEVVYVETCNIDWYQYAYLAEQAGGYLACVPTEDENDFVFSLIDEEKYFWAFPEEGEHYGIKIGPVLGGYQPEGSEEPAGGWTWLTGEAFDWTNWAQNLDDGIIDKDPRDNTQPNDSADGQPIMGFGELNVPVKTWGDYTASQTNPEGIVRGSYACIIEYDTDPALTE